MACRTVRCAPLCALEFKEDPTMLSAEEGKDAQGVTRSHIMTLSLSPTRSLMILFAAKVPAEPFRIPEAF